MKQRCNITLDAATRERLLMFGEQKHIAGGLSGVIEWIAWNQIKVKDGPIQGQTKLD